MTQDCAVEPAETMQEQMALVSGSYEGASPSDPGNQDRLSTMPNEVLFRIAEMVPMFKDKGYLILTSKYLHQIFDKHLYEASGKTLSWLPVFLAAREGDIAHLNKCKEHGAPADISWNREHDGKACVSPKIQHGASPLDEAIMNLQIGAVRWFLAQGTSPNRQKGPCSPLLRAFWIERKNTIAGLPAAQRRTHRNQYSAFAMKKLRARAEKARQIIDLLLGAGADLTFKDAARLDPELATILYVGAQLNPDLPTEPRGAGWGFQDEWG